MMSGRTRAPSPPMVLMVRTPSRSVSSLISSQAVSGLLAPAAAAPTFQVPPPSQLGRRPSLRLGKRPARNRSCPSLFCLLRLNTEREPAISSPSFPLRNRSPSKRPGTATARSLWARSYTQRIPSRAPGSRSSERLPSGLRLSLSKARQRMVRPMKPGKVVVSPKPSLAVR